VATQETDRIYSIWVQISHDAVAWIAWWVWVADSRPLALIQVPDHLACVQPPTGGSSGRQLQRGTGRQLGHLVAPARNRPIARVAHPMRARAAAAHLCDPAAPPPTHDGESARSRSRPQSPATRASQPTAAAALWAQPFHPRPLEPTALTSQRMSLVCEQPHTAVPRPPTRTVPALAAGATHWQQSHASIPALRKFDSQHPSTAPACTPWSTWPTVDPSVQRAGVN
jgi:hypothetical protein